MRRAIAPLLLAAACGAPPPPLSVQPALLDAEPVVRVHLRSLDLSRAVRVTSDGPVDVEVGDRRYRTRTPVGVSLDRGALRVGDLRARTVALSPLNETLRIGSELYPGTLVLHARGDVVAVNHVPMETYVLGVLRGELPLPRVPKAAAGALAIAVRAYTLHHLAERRELFDVDDTTTFQRYLGARPAAQEENLRAGALETRGLYLSWDGAPLKAYYHSTCGGHTCDPASALERPGPPPLRGVPCRFCEGTKYWRWEARLSDEAILQAANLSGPLRAISVGARGPGGRAVTLRVETARAAAEVHAGTFRARAGGSILRSTLLESIARTEEGVRFRGAGWGHGVGLCQMGAIGQADRGRGALDIAAYYYPGAIVRRAY
jgi:stage II sporulation protein D